MSSKSIGMVTHRHDPDKPVALAPAEKEAWQYLQRMPDEEIDFSDIPNQSRKTGWSRATPPLSELVPEENKQQITLRLDAEVLTFFKSTGKRYQSRINAVLREYVLAQKER